MFLGKTLTLTVPLSTQEYKWVPANCWGKPNKLQGNDLPWTNIPSRGSRNTPSRFILQKTGISSSYDPVGSKASFFFNHIHGKKFSNNILCYYFVYNILFPSCIPFQKVTNILTLSSQFQTYQLCYYHKNSLTGTKR